MSEKYIHSSVEHWPLGETATPDVPVGQVQLVEKLYVLHDRKSVLTFIKDHTYLISLLIDLHAAVCAIFAAPKVYLEVRSDLEEHTPDCLVAYIPSLLEPHETIQRLAEFDQQWWFDNRGRARDALFVNFS